MCQCRNHLAFYYAEPLVPEPSLIDVEFVMECWSYKFPGTDQISIEFSQRIGWNRDRQIYSFYMVLGGIATAVEGIYYLPIHENCDKTNFNIIEESPSYQLPTKFYQIFFRPC
jgi:hypothetical protein